MDLSKKYTAKAVPVPTKPGCWDWLEVTIFQQPGDVKVGSYTRNYSGMYNTFVPFSFEGREFALYSPDYTGTRVMSLPDCKDLGGEEPHEFGFCPVDFFVPHAPEIGLRGQIGFVAGCVWGDDSFWKVQALDLSRVSEGLIARDDRFGYLELPPDLTLSQCVQIMGSPVGKKQTESPQFNYRVLIKEVRWFWLNQDFTVSS